MIRQKNKNWSNHYIDNKNGTYFLVLTHEPTKSVIKSLIDSEDVNRIKVFHWSMQRDKKNDFQYVFSCNPIGNNKNWFVYLHRLVMSFPEKLMCDHINRDKLDNRRSSLRRADKSINNLNMVRTRKARRQKEVPTCLEKRKTGYSARVSYQGKRYRVGFFKTVDEGVKAVKNFKEQLLSDLYVGV